MEWGRKGVGQSLEYDGGGERVGGGGVREWGRVGPSRSSGAEKGWGSHWRTIKLL